MNQQIYPTQKCSCGHPHSKHVQFLYKEVNKKITYCQGNDEIIKCSCTEFRQADPFSLLIANIDRYMIEMDTLGNKMQWVLLNLKFFRNYSDKYLPFAWWYYINHWDLWHEPLTPTIYSKLDDANDLARARRMWREKDRIDGTELYLPFTPKVEEEHIYRQYSLEEYFIQRKSDWR